MLGDPIMGFSAVLGHVYEADGLQASPAATFLSDLEAQLPALRRDIADVADGSQAAAPAGPSATTPADELAARLKSLAARAIGLRLPLVAEELGMCEAVIRSRAVLGRVSLSERHEVDEALGRVGRVIRAEQEREATPVSGPVRAVQEGVTSHEGSELDAPMSGRPSSWQLPVPPMVLVVGPRGVVGLLQPRDRAPSGQPDKRSGAPTIEVEHTEEPSNALELARAIAPDVIVVDADLPGAKGLIETLAKGSLTAATPVVAVGTWDSAEQAAPLLAFGVARVLCKPLSPAALRKACIDLASNPAVPAFERIGQTTLEGLGQRLADELRRGLCDAVDDETRAHLVDLGAGTELVAALWGAIARIRELVSAKTEGRVRFVPTGPEGALPAASWLTSGALRTKAERSAPGQEVRRASGQRSLAGHTILVAEDDLSVNWFLVGVLREAGATVLDARNGSQALALAYKHVPDLVISDILMPELDGFALCRALKRDVVLRDVPVILLSWKEDLLQRVRELGAGAEGYLRKEASGGTIVRRMAELLQARAQVTSRIAACGSVRGRLDGLGGCSLLLLCCRHRPSARLSLRDATFLYEIEVRRGRPVRATRTAADGTTLSGAAVLGALLGVCAGRFGVEDAFDPVDEELSGTLEEQLQLPVAMARAAQGLLTGPALLDVHRVRLDATLFASALATTPEPALGLLHALDSGASPGEMLRSGSASALLLETVLSDAARAGAVRAVLAVDGTDSLARAAEREVRMLRGIADADTAGRCLAAAVRAVSHFDAQAVQESSEAALAADAAAADVVARLEDDVRPSDASQLLVSAEAAGFTPAQGGGFGTAEQTTARGSEPNGAVAPRWGAFDHAQAGAFLPGGPAPAHADDRGTPILASGLAVLPVGSRASRGQHASVDDTRALGSYGASQARASSEAAGDGRPAAHQVGAEPAPRLPIKLNTCSRSTAPFTAPRSTHEDAPPDCSEAPDSASEGRASSERVSSMPMPSAYAPSPRRSRREREKPQRSKLLVPILFGVTGVALAVGARWYREHQGAPSPTVSPQAPPGLVAAAQPQPVLAGTATAPPPAEPNADHSPLPAAQDGANASTTRDPSAEQPSPSETVEYALNKGEEVPKGEGVLEVVAGKNDEIHVNGQLIGKGPVVKVTLKAVPDPYEIRVKLRGEERVRYAVVKEGKRVRLRVAPPWAR